MFWMRNKENNFPIHTLIWGPVIYINILFMPAVKALRLCFHVCTVLSESSLFASVISTGFIQASMSKIQGLFKDF